MNPNLALPVQSDCATVYGWVSILDEADSAERVAAHLPRGRPCWPCARLEDTGSISVLLYPIPADSI